jgi:hypothetical protein
MLVIKEFSACFNGIIFAYNIADEVGLAAK